MRLKGLLLILVLFCAVTSVSAADSATLKEELKAKVASAATPEDSIRALYNLYDISNRREQTSILESIYRTAEKAGDMATRLDVLRHLANTNSGNDSILQVLRSKTAELPASIDQHQTLMYINIIRIRRNALSASEAERQVRLREVLHEYTNKEHYSTDERILLLFSLCAYLSNTAEGDLLVKYTDELEQLISNTPNTISPIRGQFYSYATIMYTNIGNHEKAANAAREVLKITDDLQEDYKTKGRIYRKFNRERYGMYRRLLLNYPAMDIAEVDSVYNKAIAITKIDPDCKAMLEKYQLLNIAHMMAHKKYSEAAPLIMKSLDSIGNDAFYRNFLLDQLNIAAEYTNDKELQLFALRENNKKLQQQIQFKSEERLRELQVIYDLQKIRESNQELEIKNRQTQLEAHETILIISIVALVIVIIITIVTFLLYVRAKQMSVSAIHAKESLEHERTVSQRHYDDLMRSRNELTKANLQKSDLINSLGHEMRTPLTAISDFTKIIVDSVDDERKPYLEHFSQIISHNVELLEAISRDILDISLLDGEEITVSRKMTDVTELCDMVVETLRQTTHSGVEMKFIQPAERVSFVTDPQRVEQILINLLKNSVRFTHAGEITLTYEADKQHGAIKFIVTDTGCGVSKEQQKTLFKQAPKGEHHSGTGLGLYLSQMIAKRLDGMVTLDTNYTDGARFILTLPL